MLLLTVSLILCFFQWMAPLVTRTELSLACSLLCPLEMEGKALLSNLWMIWRTWLPCTFFFDAYFVVYPQHVYREWRDVCPERHDRRDSASVCRPSPDPFQQPCAHAVCHPTGNALCVLPAVWHEPGVVSEVRFWSFTLEHNVQSGSLAPKHCFSEPGRFLI